MTDQDIDAEWDQADLDPDAPSGPCAPLPSRYYWDDAIAEAGEAAELLFVRGLAFCADHREADGLISDHQVAHMVGFGLTDVEDRAKALVGVGLWQRDEEHGRYIVRVWPKWSHLVVEAT